MTQTGHVERSLAAYVFGALEDDESARVREHLRDCASCRAEHVRLAELPAMIDRLPSDTAPEAAPEHLEDAVLAGFAAERPGPPRRGRRLRLPGRAMLAGSLAGAAATIAVIAVVGGFGADEQTVRLTSPDGAAASARAALRTSGAGTRVELDVDALAPSRRGEVYEVWFVRGAGRVSAGTFTLGRSGAATLVLATAANATGYERIGITREPDGLDPRRNGPNVLAGRLR